VTISQASKHGGADYTPYEGLAVVGWPLSVMLRGQFVVREGTVVGKKQAGAYVKRAKKFRQAL
jgi:dihydropyrimidinase